jgi:hypothetical protein
VRLFVATTYLPEYQALLDDQGHIDQQQGPAEGHSAAHRHGDTADTHGSER